MNFSDARIFSLRRLLFVGLLALAALAGAGCASTPPPKYVMKFYPESRSKGEGRELTMPGSGEKYWYTPTALIPEGDVVGVQLIQFHPPGPDDQPKSYGLKFQFSDSGAFNGTRALYLQTAKYQGLRIFLFINDLPFGASAPLKPIESGELDIPVDAWTAVTDKDKFADLQNFALDLQESVKRIQAIKAKQ